MPFSQFKSIPSSIVCCWYYFVRSLSTGAMLSKLQMCIFKQLHREQAICTHCLHVSLCIYWFFLVDLFWFILRFWLHPSRLLLILFLLQTFLFFFFFAWCFANVHTEMYLLCLLLFKVSRFFFGTHCNHCNLIIMRENSYIRPNDKVVYLYKTHKV